MSIEDIQNSILESIDLKLDNIINRYSVEDQVKISEVIKNLVESYVMLRRLRKGLR